MTTSAEMGTMHTRTTLRALPHHELMALAAEARATLAERLPTRSGGRAPVQDHALPAWLLVERVLLAQRVLARPA